MKLLTTENAKTVKGEKYGWITGILYLSSSRNSGYNVCPHSDKACRKACLYTAGRGAFSNVQQARIRKTRLLFQKPVEFHKQLVDDIIALARKAEKLNMKPAVRLNGTSDIPWERLTTIIQDFPDIQFYDYCASLQRACARNLPKNYYLVFSRKSNNDRECIKALRKGVNVAVVFSKVPVGKKLWGYKIIDGDLSDLRFLENPNRTKAVIVGLKAKGKARSDMSGFVIRDLAA